MVALSNEAELIEQARTGNSNAFGELVLIHQKFVFNLALRALGDPEEAEDMAQEAFICAWKALPGFRGESQFRTWLYRIVLNRCYNRRPRLRREANSLAVDEAESLLLDQEIGLERNLDSKEQQNYLHRQIAHLPNVYRMLIMLRYQQDFSYEELASIMEMPLGTVKTGLFRAKKMLRQALLEYQETAHEPA